VRSAGSAPLVTPTLPLLTRLRRDFDQREALGEIFGGAFGSGLQNRTKIEVVVPFAHAGYATLRRVAICRS
jgi:hypothetical protein